MSENNSLIKSITEAIDHLGSNINMQRDRPYTGQPHTVEGVRGSHVISGITFRDLRDAFIRAYITSVPNFKNGSMEPLEPNYTLSQEAKKGPDAVLCENDIYTLVGDLDPMALCQNLSIEIEKLMGIYPNLPGYTKGGYNHDPEKTKDYQLSNIEKQITGKS